MLRSDERRTLYTQLKANNHLKQDLISRLRTIKAEGHLTSYHLEYLLAHGAISQEEYEDIATWAPGRTAPRKRPGEVDIDSIRNTVICARSDEYLAKLPAGCVDMVITSPPYDELRSYDGQVAWDFSVFTRTATQLYRVMKEGGVMVWVVGDQISDGSKSLTSYRHALFFRELGFQVYDVIIYEKLGSGPPHPNRYFNTFEYMFVLSKGKPKTVNLLRDKENKWAGFSTYGNVTRREKDGTLTSKGKKVIQPMGVRTNIWKYANGKGFSTKDSIAYEHPAIFPEKLAADHIRSWSNEGDLILDPFAGSGTTAKMAQELGRDWIMIDAVQEYCDLIQKRLKGT
jgi:site-specific DNA-methyltransferase (adenine-specific)